MKTKSGHLSYCTNIHPGEDWQTHFKEMATHLPVIKTQISPKDKMGIGLRLSHQMSMDLLEEYRLNEFHTWLEENDFYVFTVNGFPFGQFHDTVIKDRVHTPDWTTTERLNYTLRLFDILAKILPDTLDSGGISTSPLSYRYWFNSGKERTHALEKSTLHIIQVAEYLHNLRLKDGKNLHLDLEPEPDGLIENGKEFIYWYEEILIPMANKQLITKGIKSSMAEDIIRRHIQLCYDVCHMAVEYEDQQELTDQLKSKNIPIGKIQLSSALRLPAGRDLEILRPFDEPQYLHQVVIRKSDGSLKKFKDLPDAFTAEGDTNGEWRVHFHVPVFAESYGSLSSTRDYIKEILSIQQQIPLTDHLEIETYTWDILPEELQLPIGESIIREIKYIQDIL